MDILETLSIEKPDTRPEEEMQQHAVNALEEGKVVFFPNLMFNLEPAETKFLSPTVLHGKSKNISYDAKSNIIKGTSLEKEEDDQMKRMLHRFAVFASSLLENLYPLYLSRLVKGKTSFRPVEASKRTLSRLKDDTLLHVDSFPSNPVQGQRILRCFTNINPEGKPRIWKVGEPFDNVLDKMVCRVKKPFPGLAGLLKALGITKGYRTLYDHYMLKIHDNMKNDRDYQLTVPQREVCFPAGSSWMVFTDQVSHAVISGQYVLEQTFHFPPSSMKFEQKSPLRMLEKKLSQKLIF